MGLQPSGKAWDCNSLIVGSNPTRPSNKKILGKPSFFVFAFTCRNQEQYKDYINYDIDENKKNTMKKDKEKDESFKL